MDYGVAMRSYGQQRFQWRAERKPDLLRKDFDKAASKSLVADTADSVFSDYYSPIPALVTAIYAIAKPELRFFADSKRTAQAGYDTALVHDCIRCSYPPPEV